MQHVAELSASSQSMESTFAWKARDTNGSVCSGTMSAVSHNDVANRLRSDGRYVISIRESATGTGHVAAADRFRPKMNRTDTISFFRQLSVMLSAGVSISEALDAAVKQTSDTGRRAFLTQIQEEVESGDSLLETSCPALAKGERPIFERFLAKKSCVLDVKRSPGRRPSQDAF